MPRGSGMSQTKRRRLKALNQEPVFSVSDMFKEKLGWKPSTTPFWTTARRECGSCHAIKPGSEFNVPETPGRPDLNTCRECSV
jgi:hypothetical protein